MRKVKYRRYFFLPFFSFTVYVHLGGEETKNQLCEFANFNSHARHLPLTVTFTLPSPLGVQNYPPPPPPHPQPVRNGLGGDIMEEIGDLCKVVFVRLLWESAGK